jgi:hypothetical protein
MTPLRILQTTRENWSENLADETIEQHPILKMLQSGGRLKTNSSGTDFKWTVQYKESGLIPYTDGDDLSFARQELFQTALLSDTRGYKATDFIHEREMLQNKGKHAIIKLFESQAERMKEMAGRKLCAEFYVDGYAPGNERRLRGLESMMGITPGSQVATDFEATVYADTYATLATAKGTYGGVGVAAGGITTSTQREYDFWTPTIVNTNRTGTTWAANADQHLRYAIMKHSRGHAMGQSLDMILLTRTALRALFDLLSSKERVVVTQGDVGIRKFGFKEVVNFDGVDVTFDPDIPATDVNSDVVHGYGFTTSKMALKLLGDSLWHASGDEFLPIKQGWGWWVGNYGDLVFESPKHFAKFADVS